VIFTATLTRPILKATITMSRRGRVSRHGDHSQTARSKLVFLIEHGGAEAGALPPGLPVTVAPYHEVSPQGRSPLRWTRYSQNATVHALLVDQVSLGMNKAASAASSAPTGSGKNTTAKICGLLKTRRRRAATSLGK